MTSETTSVPENKADQAEIPATETVQVARVHNAREISDQIFWAGHIAAIVLMVVAVLCIVLAKGPRRKDATQELASPKA